VKDDLSFLDLIEYPVGQLDAKGVDNGLGKRRLVLFSDLGCC
jgi:hypothetical protein